MKKSIPPTVKHLACQCKIVNVDSGPHKRKIVCIDHNNAFVQWVPKEYEGSDWPEQLDSFVIEGSKRRTQKYLYDNGTVFDKMKYSDVAVSNKVKSIIDKIKGE